MQYTPHPDDDRANIHGVFRFGIETIKVPIRKTTKATAEILLVQLKNGEWVGGYQYTTGDGGGGQSPSLIRTAYDSRNSTALAVLNRLRDAIAGRPGSDARISEDLDRFSKLVATFGLRPPK